MKTAIILVAGLAAGTQAQLINEFEPNPAGGDLPTVNFEIRGDAGSAFNGFLYSVEGDFGAGVDNFVDRVSQISGVFDSNGILNVQIADLENPSFTVVLASGGSADTSSVYDGTNGAALFGTVFDAINIIDDADAGADSIVPTLGVGVNFAYTGDEPGLVFRDGLDSSIIYAVNEPQDGVAYDQFGNTYDLATAFFDANGNAIDLSGLAVGDIATFGGINYTTIPAPGAAAVLGLGGLVAARRRR